MRRYHVILTEHSNLLLQVALQRKMQMGMVQYDALHFIYTKPMCCKSQYKVNAATLYNEGLNAEK